MRQLPGDTRIALLEDAVERLSRNQEVIGEALTKLVRLEERHAETRDALGRAFKGIENNRADINALKQEMPQLREARKWVVAGVLAGIALIGLGVFKAAFGEAPTSAAHALPATR